MTDAHLPTRRDLAHTFREIEASTGLLMRDDFMCCSSCAGDRLDREAAEADRPPRYAFWHAQDTEAAVATDVLYIGYAGMDDADTTAVGHVLVAALTGRGYFVRWDGSPDTRLAIAVCGVSFDRDVDADAEVFPAVGDA